MGKIDIQFGVFSQATDQQQVEPKLRNIKDMVQSYLIRQVNCTNELKMADGAIR